MPTKVKYKSLKPNGKNATGRPDKWTLEWAMAELNEWQILIDEDKNILLLSDVCEKRDYAHKVFLDRTEKFKEIPEFNEFYKKLDQKLSNKYIRIMISNKFNTGAMIFLAKNRLGMVDNINLDHTSKGESITSFRVEIVNGKSN